MSKLSEFKERDLYPALWDRIAEAFPEMSFTLRGGKWISPMHLDGTRSKSGSPDQCTISAAYKHLIRDNNPAYGGAISLIDFEMRRSNCDFATALERLCRVCSLTPPSEENEEQRKQRELRRNEREEAQRRFVAALWGGSAGAEEVLAYLRGRQWTNAEIKAAQFGYIDEQLRGSLPAASLGMMSSEIGRSHRLTIPYRSGSRLVGFKFRNIHYSKERGGAKYLNTQGLPKGSGFFGIGIGIIRDLTIVEGELDALHAQVKGAYNIVATAGQGASEGQIEDAIKRGCKRFTLLFDNDEAGRTYTDATADIIHKKGGQVFVAQLPPEYKDTDEYLAAHSLDELQGIIDAAENVTIWRYLNIERRFAESVPEDKEVLRKARQNLFDEIGEVYDKTPALDRELLIRLTAERLSEPLVFTQEGLRAAINTRYLRVQAAQRGAQAKAAAGKVQELLKEGQTDEAIRLMRETAYKLGSEAREAEYSRIFATRSAEEEEKDLSRIPTGIPTGILFTEGKRKESLTLNAGLTFVCGYRGHGKTSFLNNLALNEAARNLHYGTGRSVLYFSYEVDRRRLITDLLGTYVNDPLLNRSKSPQDAIVSYFKGEKKWISTQPMSGSNLSHLENFEQKKQEFLRDYISSGAIQIVEEDYKIEQLLEALRYYLTICTPSIVCIDYAQLIFSEDYSRLRTEEIKKVVSEIRVFAKEHALPFVLAAQFNREVNSPASVDTKNIGEGGDFERVADTCIGLFNLKELHSVVTNKAEEDEAKRILQRAGLDYTAQEGGRAKPLGKPLEPIPNKLYVKLMKRRYGYYPMDTLLFWEGRTKKITLNDEGALWGRGETEQAERAEPKSQSEKFRDDYYL